MKGAINSLYFLPTKETIKKIQRHEYSDEGESLTSEEKVKRLVDMATKINDMTQALYLTCAEYGYDYQSMLMIAKLELAKKN